jgi:hypothetical protein
MTASVDEIEIDDEEEGHSFRGGRFGRAGIYDVGETSVIYHIAFLWVLRQRKWEMLTECKSHK